MPSSNLVAFLCLAPLFIALGLMILIRRIRGEHRRKKPFPEGQRGLRWAGYSLQRELDVISEKIDLALIMLMVIPAIAVASYATAAFRQEDSRISGIIITGVALAGIGWAMLSLFKNVKLSQRKRLGMLGEQVVGEALNQLMRAGCFVFHDLPMTGWNIDHIVIGETGVFAVETKASRKHRQTTSGKAECRIEFDGERISYPEIQRIEFKPVKQAREAARGLERFIEERAKLKVPVTALLVYPGWYVHRKGKSDVTVLNPGEIEQVVLDGKRQKLSSEFIERIVAVIERECRDVAW